MKRFLVAISVACFLLMSSVASFAQDRTGQYYSTFKGGVYSPTGDLHDGDFDEGPAGEITMGYYINNNFATEFGIGYFRTESEHSETVSELGSVSELGWDVDLQVIPITATFKAVIPFDNVELYAGAGIGAYLYRVDVDVSESVTIPGSGTISGSFSDDDTSAVVGGHFVLGATFDISPKWFLGVEGKYLFTDEATAFDEDIEIGDLNGFTATGVIGYRF
jgi:opacity protein-like surface antigen